ncbi:MAG: hypothetical protein OXI01_23995 [Albidovulum sp.]|nr:hypothetical protein [Albidovulum sp.]
MKIHRLRFPKLRRRPHTVLAAWCSLCLAASWIMQTPIVPAALAEPMVEHAVSGEADVSRDAAILARRILTMESDDLLLDDFLLDRLGREVHLVLTRIRNRYPAMKEIAARQSPATLILEIQGKLLEDLIEHWTDLGNGSAPPTGHGAFDELNAKLGLHAVDLYPTLSVVILHFPERANLRIARKRYSAIAGVAGASIDSLLTDGSGIDAFKTNGAWFVAMRKAWGDCPSGCINSETHYYSIKGESVELIDVDLAQEALRSMILELPAKNNL